MSALIYVNPLWGTLDPKRWLGGSLAAGRQLVNAAYDNSSPANANAHAGMLAVVDCLARYPGTALDPTILLGWSMGAQIVFKFIRERLPGLIAGGLNPATVNAYVTGCPEQKFTGASVLYPANEPAVYPGTTAHTAGCPTPAEFHGGYGIGYGLPPTVPIKTWVIANQHDGWADAPAGNLALPEVSAMFDHSPFCPAKQGSTTNPHGSYSRPITDPAARSYVDPAQPNVTYVWLPTYPLPNIVWARSIKFWMKWLDQPRRTIVEGQYTRPTTIPLPNYAAVPAFIQP